MVIALLVGGALLYKYALSIRGRAVAAHLKATEMDLKVAEVRADEVLSQFHSKLVEKDPYFADCAFEFQPPVTHAFVTLELSRTSGFDCLTYIAGLSGCRVHLQSRKVILMPSDVDARDVVERTIDRTSNWFKHAIRWARNEPSSPPDPFAPAGEPPPFPFDRISR
ncbi:hypothetical protein AYO49_02275 [Verrucomicrobiaceae bacterium SCGC AG-212-N21]|nr:hypothetical protein AYO49_02275 [Verrucomicrobiaceae bacterium SCGC AG-212-N21]